MASRLIDSFYLYDLRGRQYLAHLYQDYEEIWTAEGRSSIPRLKEYLLADGTPLNPVDENTFQNVVTDQLLTRTQPRTNS